MSALDWGGGTGTNATPRYYTFTSPALPNSDWCIGIWVRKSAITGSATQELFGIGTPGAADSIYLYLGETSFGFIWGCEGYNSGGTNWINTAKSGTPAQDGNDYLLIVQRRSNVIEVVQVLEGATASAFDFASSTVSGTISAQASRIGYSSSNLANRNPLGEFFIFDDRALTLTQITTLAAGAPASVIATPKVLLRFRGGEVTTETNAGSGGATNDATKVSTGFTTTTDFFAGNPVISSVSTSSPRHTETLTINGSGFGATQGSGYVSLAGRTQYNTVSWSDTAITITVDRDINKYGGPVNVSVIDNGLNTSGPYALTALLPPTGWGYVDIGTPNTTAANRITASPDIASGDQVAYNTVGSTVTVLSDGTFSLSGSTTSFNAEAWTNPDGWGATRLQWLVNGPPPRSIPMLGYGFGRGPIGEVITGTLGTGVSLTVANASSATTESTVALTQAHALTTAAASSAATVAAFAITQRHSLAVAAASSATTSSTPAVSQAHVLAVSAASSATTESAPALTQAHALTVAAASSATTTSTPSLTQAHALSVSGATSTTTASTVAITVSGGGLTVDSASTATTTSTPAITQAHALAVAAASSSTTESTPSLTQAHVLVAAAAASAATTGTVALTQTHQLAVAGGTSATTETTPAVSQVHQLAVSGSTSSTTASTLSLALDGGLIVAPASSATTLSGPALTQAHQLTTAGAASGTQVSTTSLLGDQPENEAQPGGGGGGGRHGSSKQHTRYQIELDEEDEELLQIAIALVTTGALECR